MNRKKLIPKSELLRLWKTAKHSLGSLAAHFGVTPGTIKRRFLEWDLSLPTQSDSQRARLRRMTKKERQQLTDNAREARKLACTPEALHAKALTRQKNQTGATYAAIQLCNSLLDAGFNSILELAVDKFNVDVAVPHLKVAIELDGGNWHAGGQIRPRDIAKENTLHSLGWIVLRYTNAYTDEIIAALNRISPPPI